MIKKLVKHGNSYALIIDKPIMELLGITPDTPLTITAAGTRMVISQETGQARQEVFQEAIESGNRKYGKMLKRLAE